MGVLGVECVVTERLHSVHIAHVAEIVEVPGGNLLDLVGSPKAVEEVDEGHATADGREVCDRREIHDLLDVALRQHGEAGLAAGHDVGVIAKDVEGLGRHRTCGHVEDTGKSLSGYLVHVGNHEQQPLRGRVGRREGTRAQRAMDGPRGTTLRLHLNDLDGRAEDVLEPMRRPLIHVIGHRA